MSILGMIGVLLGIVLMIYLVCFRNWNVMLATLLASLLIALFNAQNLWTAISEAYLSGAAGWVQDQLILFTLGALFGRVLQRTGAAQAVGTSLSKVIGKKYTGIVIHLLGFLLVYGGIDCIVACLTIAPIATQMCKEANVPRRYGFACMCGGISSYALSMPGSPIVHNLMPTWYLGTTTIAAWKLGLCIFIINILLEYCYIVYLRNKFLKANAGFVPANMVVEKDENGSGSAASGYVCLLIVILSSIILGGIVGLTSLMVVCTALAVSSAINLIWNYKRLKLPIFKILEEGTMDGIVGCLLCAAVLGFVGVVQSTEAFTAFSNWTNGLGTNMGYFGIFLSIQLMAACLGNSPGTLNIFLENFAQNYIAMGMTPEVVHRLASTSCMGFDAMPHNPGTITFLRTYGLSYREAYIDVFITMCACPVIAAFCGCCLAFLGVA
ncbi:MAG: hypothetical protein LUE06_07570 [Oscillospiraceae bacterium]|nr:hypothetical protein [Oscillospiraceae bacterium]